jgi:hypothetical protein
LIWKCDARRRDAAMIEEATIQEQAEGGAAAVEPAGAARLGLGAAIDRASSGLRGVTRAGEEWARDAEGRAIELGKGLRDQGTRAVGKVARRVENNPIASVAIAFILGFLCAALVRRANR